MPVDRIIAFSVFALVTSITPGPNNLMLLASGVNFGFRSSIPHVLGISIGFLVMVLAVGLGLAELFEIIPRIYDILKWVGATYMVYLAWGIVGSGAPEEARIDSPRASPLGFWGAATFQWVNPKAWVMAIGAFSTYVPATSGILTITATATLFALINLPSVGIWALFGSSLRYVLRVERNRRAFNYIMAGLLVASLYPLSMQ